VADSPRSYRKRTPSLTVMLVLSSLLGGIIALGLFTAFRPTPVEAAPARLADLQSSFIAVADQVRPAVVNINTEQLVPRQRGYYLNPWGSEGPLIQPYTRYEKVTSLGSGFIVRPDGVILTNAHVIAGAQTISVTLADDTTVPARVIGALADQDLALLKIDTERDLPTVRLGDADAVQVGSWAVAIGSPFGFTETVTVGVISAKDRVMRQDRGRRVMRDLLQTDAAINSGNSGGPLLNLDGDVIGINQAIFSPSGGNIGIGFAIPVNAQTKAAIDEAINAARQRV